MHLAFFWFYFDPQWGKASTEEEDVLAWSLGHASNSRLRSGDPEPIFRACHPGFAISVVPHVTEGIGLHTHKHEYPHSRERRHVRRKIQGRGMDFGPGPSICTLGLDPAKGQGLAFAQAAASQLFTPLSANSYSNLKIFCGYLCTLRFFIARASAPSVVSGT